MTSTSVKVALRVRPLTAKEALSNCSECISFIQNEPQVVLGLDRSFTFDYVFNPNVPQDVIYSTCVAPLIGKFIEGYNATVLAYGQTGSGKTYSMGTGLDGQFDPDAQGIVPRAIHALFSQLPFIYPPPHSYQVSVSFLELYNEELIDLLNPTRAHPNTSEPFTRPGSASSSKSEPPLRIREDEYGNIVWVGVREEICQTPEQLLGILSKGSLCRTTGSTDMNMVSSRSHAIFSVTLRIMKVEEAAEIQKIQCKFHFVDLAGSERLKKTNAEGTRAKEGISINSGLLALGNVISALGDESRQEQRSHIPYRDSKLTRLLQDSLGGNSQTLMLACVSPADSNFQETLNTLKYANRARNIKNKVVINQQASVNTLEVQQLRTQITRLKLELSALKETSGGSMIKSSSIDSLDRSKVCDLQKENGKLEFQTHRLEERIQELEGQVLSLQSERDTLLLKVHGLPPLPLVSNTSTTTNSTEHPLIKEYLTKINALKKQVFTQETELAFFKRHLTLISQVSQHYEPSKRPYSARESRGLRFPSLTSTASIVGSIPSLDAPASSSSSVQQLLAKAKDHIQQDVQFLLSTSSFPFKEGNESPSPSSTPPELADSLKLLESVIGTSGGPEKRPATASSTSSSRGTQPTLFLLHKTLQRIQSNLGMKEELVQALEKTHQTYTTMQQSYDEKFLQLQANVNAVKQERDQALSRIQGANTKEKEKELRSKFETKVKQLLNEISQLRRTQLDNSKAISSNKKSEYVLRQLRGSMDALKQEKQKLLKRIKDDAEKAKEQASVQDREIQKLKRKEKLAMDMAKKFERNFELQKLLLKKRTEEVVASHQKLKNVTSILQRSSAHKSFKNNSSTPPAPPPSSLSLKTMGLDAEGTDGLSLKDRQQALYKAIELIVSAQRVHQQMEEFIARRKQLTEEKLVLQKEREHVLANAAHLEPDTTLYLDEPIALLDSELQCLDTRIKSLQSHVLDHEPLEHSYEWLNQCVRSLNLDDAVALLQSILDDVIQLQIVTRNQSTEVKQLNEITAQLRRTIFRMQNTAIGNTVNYEKKMKTLPPPGISYPFPSSLPATSSTSAQPPSSTWGRSRAQDPDIGSSLRTSDNPPTHIPVASFSPPSSVVSSLEEVAVSNEVSKSPPVSRPDSKSTSHNQPRRPRPAAAMGQDVFERLAKTYTVASQAKVRDLHREEPDASAANAGFPSLPLPSAAFLETTPNLPWASNATASYTSVWQRSETLAPSPPPAPPPNNSGGLLNNQDVVMTDHQE